MKNWLILLVLAWFLSSCSALKSALQPPQPADRTQTRTGTANFIEGIEIQPVESATVVAKSSQSGKNAVQEFGRQLADVASALELFSVNQFKYAIRLDVPVELLQNRYLYDFIDDWWKTPYRLGGTAKTGIDCSAFVQTLMLSVFGLNLPRTAREQKSTTERIPDSELREGDLVFFNTGRGVSHVGVYLHNNKFVHASTTAGVIISDLAEPYWSRRYLGAGRLSERMHP
ncbi:MAG: NlpC/P60 family protein [Lacibacter sp.]